MRLNPCGLSAIQGVPDCTHEECRAVGRLQIVRSGHLGCGGGGVLRKSTGERNRQFRRVFQKLRRRRGFSDVGHYYAQYGQVRPLQLRHTEHLPPVGCSEHIVTKPGQQLPRKLANRVAILR